MFYADQDFGVKCMWCDNIGPNRLFYIGVERRNRIEGNVTRRLLLQLCDDHFRVWQDDHRLPVDKFLDGTLNPVKNR